MIWATARAALLGSAYPIAKPMSVNGSATITTAPSASSSPVALTVASVNSAAITTTGTSETIIIARPARMRPAKRGPGPTGRVRVYGSQGWLRSSETPMP